MKKIKALIIGSAFLSLSAFTTSAIALEGFSVGASMNYAGFYAHGKETNHARVIEETGAFQDTHPAVFLEANINDTITVGLEYVATGISTPTNENAQFDHQDGGSDSQKTNKASVEFDDYMSLYVNINTGFLGTYLKAGISRVDIVSTEDLGTGGAYGNTDTKGVLLGLGVSRDLDQGLFVRLEAVAHQYDDVDLTNENDSQKKIEIFDMIGAHAALRIGKTF